MKKILVKYLFFDVNRRDCYKGNTFAKFNTAKNVLRRELIYDIMGENLNQMKCYAGTLNAVIYPNGDLYACEMFDNKIGDMKDYDFDMKKIWLSKEADLVRDEIKNKKCICTHECFLTTNILYNIGFYPKILKWWVKL